MLSNLNSNLALTLGCLNPDLNNSALKPAGGGGEGTLGISGRGCAAGTLEPLTYTRASSAEFCYPLLE